MSRTAHAVTVGQVPGLLNLAWPPSVSLSLSEQETHDMTPTEELDAAIRDVIKDRDQHPVESVQRQALDDKIAALQIEKTRRDHP